VVGKTRQKIKENRTALSREPKNKKNEGKT